MNIRQEITVLPADEPTDRKIGFIVKEYIGSEVYKDLTPGPDGNPVPLRKKGKKEDLQEGDIAYAWGGDVKFQVYRGDHGILHGRTGNYTVILEFAKDDRKAWVAGAIVNMKALKKLELYSK